MTIETPEELYTIMWRANLIRRTIVHIKVYRCTTTQALVWKGEPSKDRTQTLREDIFTDREKLETSTTYIHYKWEEVHSWLMDKCQRAVDRARRELELQKGYLGNVKGMKQPEVIQ